MKIEEVNWNEMFIDERYRFRMDDGRTIVKKGMFLMMCDPKRGWCISEERLSHIVEIIPEMTVKNAIQICKAMNEWRRGSADEPMPMPYTSKQFGEAIDELIRIAEKEK